MTELIYINWDAATPEILQMFHLLNMFADRPYIQEVVRSERFRMLHYEFDNHLGTHRNVNEFVDLMRALCQLVWERETADAELDDTDDEIGAEDAGLDTAQLDGPDAGSAGRPSVAPRRDTGVCGPVHHGEPDSTNDLP